MRRTWLLACAALTWCGQAGRADNAYPQTIPHPKDQPVYNRLTTPARDGISLIVHEWAPAKPAAGTPVVLFLHGIAMHGEPYGAIAAGFTTRGVAFIAPDLRGHGRSEGPRGEMPPAHVLRADIGAVLALVNKRFPGAPVVLMGESMGGLLAADYAWRGEGRLAGLALLAPAFALHPAQVKLGEVGHVLTGRVPIATDRKLKPSSRDEGFVRARKADKLALAEVKLSYLTALAVLQAEWPRAASELKLPLFVGVAGKDVVIDANTARKVHDSAGSASKTWQRWDDAYHTLSWDPATAQSIEDVVKWVLTLTKEK
jgi:alpha-beta hydrolase superfamily lysophospholipase